MYTFMSEIAKDLFILMCIPLFSEIGSYLLSKKEKLPANLLVL